MDSQEVPASQDSPEHQESREPHAQLKTLLASNAQLEPQAQLVHPDQLAMQEAQDSPDNQDREAEMVHPAHLDPQAQPVNQDSQEAQDSPASQVRMELDRAADPDPRDHQAHPDSQEHQASPEVQATQVDPAQLDHPASPAPPDNPVEMDTPVSQDKPVFQVPMLPTALAPQEPLCSSDASLKSLWRGRSGILDWIKKTALNFFTFVSHSQFILLAYIGITIRRKRWE